MVGGSFVSSGVGRQGRHGIQFVMALAGKGRKEGDKGEGALALALGKNGVCVWDA